MKQLWDCTVLLAGSGIGVVGDGVGVDNSLKILLNIRYNECKTIINTMKVPQLLDRTHPLWLCPFLCRT